MRPYDDKGRFVPLACPRADCGGGKLVHEEGKTWICDGLADPGHDSKPLVKCSHWHYDGESEVRRALVALIARGIVVEVGSIPSYRLKRPAAEGEAV